MLFLFVGRLSYIYRRLTCNLVMEKGEGATAENSTGGKFKKTELMKERVCGTEVEKTDVSLNSCHNLVINEIKNQCIGFRNFSLPGHDDAEKEV